MLEVTEKGGASHALNPHTVVRVVSTDGMDCEVHLVDGSRIEIYGSYSTVVREWADSLKDWAQAIGGRIHE